MPLRKRLRRWSELSATERILLLRAFATLALVRIGLWILPLQAVRRIAVFGSSGVGKPPVRLLTWAVRAASRYVPGASCLPQAVALQSLLSASGFASRLEIGVAREYGHGLEAHAWIVCEDEVVIGGPDVSRFEPITVLDA